MSLVYTSYTQPIRPNGADSSRPHCEGGREFNPVDQAASRQSTWLRNYSRKRRLDVKFLDGEPTAELWLASNQHPRWCLVLQQQAERHKMQVYTLLLYPLILLRRLAYIDVSTIHRLIVGPIAPSAYMVHTGPSHEMDR
jgi:hypothetical protein